MTSAGDGTIKVRRLSDGMLLRTINTLGHRSAAFSPDGTLVGTVGTDSFGTPSVTMRRTSDGQVVWSAPATSGQGVSVRFSGNGQYFLASPDYGKATVYRVSDGTAICTVNIGVALSEFQLSPDGSELTIPPTSSATDATWRVYSVATGLKIREWPARDATFGTISGRFVYSPDGTQLAVSGYRDPYTNRTGIFILNAQNGQVVGVSTGPGTLAHSGLVWKTPTLIYGLTSAGGGVGAIDKFTLWTGGSRVATGSGFYIGTSLSISDDLRYAGLGGSGDPPSDNYNLLHVLDLGVGNVSHTLTEHRNGVLGVAFSPDGSTLASSAMDNTIRLWNTLTGDLQRTITTPSFYAYERIKYFPSGKKLLASRTNSTSEPLRIFDLESGSTTLVTYPSGVRAMDAAPSPDGKSFATADSDGYVRLWDAATLTVKAQNFMGSGGANGPTAIAYSRSGNRLAIAYGYNMSVFDGNLVVYGDFGCPAPVSQVGFSPNSNVLYAFGNGTVQAIDLVQRQTLWLTPAVSATTLAGAVDPGGRLILSSFGKASAPENTGRYKLWYTSGSPYKTYDREAGDGSFPLQAVTFTPDGQFFAFARRDATVGVARNPLYRAPYLTKLTLSTTMIAGGRTARGTVSVNNPAPVGGATVTLSSSNPALVNLPPSVVIPGGQYNISFDVPAVQPVPYPQDVLVTASYLGKSFSQTLTVRPAWPSSIWFAANPVTGGTALKMSVSLDGPAPAEGLRVGLHSSDPALVPLPEWVTVPAGAKSKSFTVQTAATGGTARTVTVTAYVGPGWKSRDLTVQ